MNDLEERLRADLLGATEAVEPDVDVEALVASGHRARTNRAVRRVALGTAGVLAVGAVLWTGVGPSTTNGNPPVAATPSPVSSMVPADPLSTTFDLSDEGMGKSDPAIESIRVAVQPSGTQVDVTVTVTTQVATMERGFRVPAGQAWHVAWDKRLAIGILPDRALWFDTQQDSGKGVYSGQQALVGIGATAFWEYFEESGGPGTIRGLVWQRPDGAVRDTEGDTVPSATVAFADTSCLVYRDVALDVFGIRPRDGGGYTTAVGKPSGMLHGGVGRKDGSTWTWTQAGVLPAGSSDISVTLVGADGAWGSAPMTDGSVAVVAMVRGTDKGDIVKSLSYTDASGTRVTLGG